MNRQERLVAIVVLALIAATSLAIYFAKPHLGKPGLSFEKAAVTNEFGEVIRDERIYLPESVPGFRSEIIPVTSMEATNLPPDTGYGRKYYRDNEGFGAQMSAVMMKTDRTSIHRPELCVRGQGWNIQKTEVIEIPIASPFPYTLKATCLTSNKVLTDPKTKKEYPRTAYYIYWFISENRLVPTHSELQWVISKDLITSGTLYPWAYVSCFSTCPPQYEGAALERMKRLIATSVPEFQLFPPNPKQTASLSPSPSLP